MRTYRLVFLDAKNRPLVFDEIKATDEAEAARAARATGYSNAIELWHAERCVRRLALAGEGPLRSARAAQRHAAPRHLAS